MVCSFLAFLLLPVVGEVCLCSDDLARVQIASNHCTGLKATLCAGAKPIKYEIEERGSLYTSDYRLYLRGPEGYVSLWHDIPLYADRERKIFNMVVEIPRWSNAKMETATDEPLSPIRQEVKNGVLRFIRNIFPLHGYSWNYGALPQTWESNEHIDEHLGATGDNDPIDVVEIGTKAQRRGAVIQVKVVGALSRLDRGETDWKLIAIDIDDPLAEEINSMEDVERHYPGFAKMTYEWFFHYKIPPETPSSDFSIKRMYRDMEYSHKVIEDTHSFWRDLISRQKPHLNTSKCPFHKNGENVHGALVYHSTSVAA